MKQIMIVLLGLMMTVSCGGVITNRAGSPVVQHIDNSTVALVHTMKESGDVKVYCTGVWVSDDEILTAYHCVEGAAQITAIENGEDPEDLESLDLTGTPISFVMSDEVGPVGGIPSTIHIGVASKLDADHDLALVKRAKGGERGHDVAVLASSSPGVGEHVKVVGHVVGLYWTHMECIVAAYREDLSAAGVDKSGPWLQLSGPVYKGNSGGGAFDSEGKLVGIASFITKAAPDVGFFIHAETIRQFLMK